MATTTVNSSNPVRNNSSFILHGGTLSNTSNTATKTLATHNSHVGPHIVRVPLTTWTAKVTSGGTFANLARGKYVVQGYCNELAGVSNTLLSQAGATRGRRGIAPLETIYTFKEITAGYNWATGAHLTNPSNVLSNFGTDDAARSSRSAPGEWAYHYGANTGPTIADYPAKTG